LPDDPLVHACALSYLSDIGTGLSVLEQEDAAPGGRRPGWCTGSVTTRDSSLAAGFVQEALFRPGPNPFRRGERPIR